jgi:DNA-binding NarL/FixJ family response regulator
MATTLVYVLAPNRLAGEYLAQVLAQESDFYVTFCDDLPRNVAESTSVVFVLDNSFLLLPLGEYLCELRSRFTEPKFVVVDNLRSEDEIVRLLTLGIQAVIDHREAASTLLPATKAVVAGEYWVPKHILRKYMLLMASKNQKTRTPASAMTSRELQVLELLKQRLSNKEIAQILKLRESTVKFHVSHILGKMNVGSRRDLEPELERVRALSQLLD